MKIDYSKINDVIGEITMVVEESDYAEKVKKQLKEIGKKHAEPGFRPGKVPAGLIAKKYGNAVKYDEINKLVGDALFEYIKENDINVLGNPIPDKGNAINEDANEFTLKFKVGVAPEFDVKADKEVTIPYYNIEVTDEMIDRQDNALRSRMGKQQPGEEVDATALVKGVITELNEDGSVKADGVVVENGIVGPAYFKSEAQRDLFVGKKVGDTVVFNPAQTCEANPAELSSMLNLPKEEAEKHQGDFQFEIKEIIVLKPAELNEEYFKEVFGDDVKDADQYREAVKKMIQTSLKGDQNYRFSIDAKDVLLNNVGQVELPDEVLKEFLISRNEGLTAENIDEQYEGIRNQLVWDLTKDKLAKKLDVKVEEDDLLNTARLLARNQFAQYGMANVPEDAVEHYASEILKDEKARASVYNQTAEMKLFQTLQGVVTLDEKNVSVDDFNKLFLSNDNAETEA
ncbi:MAG: trigger factor [Bacteroides sp.]|nr:trigger factor [Bacteroidales bacterium]MBD5205907.1 trigger factor [Bacteroidales bacterium]MBD5222654.1 trigger factor [Bacteroidales bacterium]MBD5302035.1 trigger factor [Bacteroides sp.]MBD5305342.1 trigger factor [Bacteroides sp.]